MGSSGVSGGGLSPSQVAAIAVTQQQGLWLPTDSAALAWSADPYLVTSNTAPPVAGRLELFEVKLAATSPVTNIVMQAQGAGVGLSAGQNFAALFTRAGALVGQTGDQSTALASAGTKTRPIAGGPVANLNA